MLTSIFIFATWIVQFIYHLNPKKFPASSHLLLLYSLVCVAYVLKPHTVSWFFHNVAHMSRPMVTAKLISAFVFATRIVQFLFYLNPKFQASSSFLCLYRPVCVRPVWKAHCWFSHEAAHILIKFLPELFATISLSDIIYLPC